MKAKKATGFMAIMMVLFMSLIAAAQSIQSVPLQPFAGQVRDVEATLSFLGQPLASGDQKSINTAFGNPDPAAAVSEAEAILDKYTLAAVTINAESRVSVKPGLAPAELIQNGTRVFLVKVVNRAGVTAPLVVESPNSGEVYLKSTADPTPAQRLTMEDVAERWSQIYFYDKPMMFRPPVAAGNNRLSGFGLEYRLLVIYSRDAGQRSAKLSFNVGQGTQDIGFRSEITILFAIAPAHSITLHVFDDIGEPTMASFIFRDNVGRIYPSQTKRLAPDFFFQQQVYRADGEFIDLPEGSYNVTVTGGPEYITETRNLTVDAHGPHELSFRLRRWIDLSHYRYYSGDHHIHAAGCAHYENPSEGVLPKDMGRQVQGEHLNVGSILTWAPCYYYQKRFFSGKDDPVSKPGELLHYDVEVSGFPSSHAGHLVLLGLINQDYPNTQRIESWPTWDLPILQWAKSQGATAGFAHSGAGLALHSDALPNYEVPGFDSVGANEYVVDVTYPNTVDFISAGDTPYPWELNIWYHTLNVGFRTRIAGETDFPCITDIRVGTGRSYAKVDGPLTYNNWLTALRQGRSYVSDGKSHLIDFAVNDTEVGTQGSEIQLTSPSHVRVEVNAAAYLDPIPDRAIRQISFDRPPFWNLERGRVGDTRNVRAELVVNGYPVAQQEMVADGTLRKLKFDVPILQSSWIAIRILPSSHTNPIFVIVGGKPIRASRRSAEWCLAGVNQCWTQKAPQISARDLPEAKNAYDHARATYQKLIAECEHE